MIKKRISNRAAATIILLFMVFCAGFLGWAWNLSNNWFSVRWLEYKVKRNVDPDQLQRWATNLLAQQSRQYEDFYGTNVPPGIANVQAYPAIRIFEPDAVWLFADRKRSPFLVVGAPSLVIPTNGNIFPWRPGIYFVR